MTVWARDGVLDAVHDRPSPDCVQESALGNLLDACWISEKAIALWTAVVGYLEVGLWELERGHLSESGLLLVCMNHLGANEPCNRSVVAGIRNALLVDVL